MEVQGRGLTYSSLFLSCWHMGSIISGQFSLHNDRSFRKTTVPLKGTLNLKKTSAEQSSVTCLASRSWGSLREVQLFIYCSPYTYYTHCSLVELNCLEWTMIEIKRRTDNTQDDKSPDHWRVTSSNWYYLDNSFIDMFWGKQTSNITS